MNPFALTDEFLEVFEAWDGEVGAPSPANRKRNRLRVYKNGFVENVLASSHPALPGLWFGPFVAFGVYSAVTASVGALLGVALFMAGVLGFTLVEYLLHRFPFHYKGSGSRSARMRLFLMHGYHHQFPNDKWRLVAPPLMSWPIAIVLIGVYALLFPSVMWIVFGGTCAGYLAYDWIHYYTHHGRNPRTWVGKTLRTAHAAHHYSVFHLNMGISTPLWDVAFGTFGWSKERMRAALKESREVEKTQG